MLWILAMFTSLFFTALAVSFSSSFKKKLWRHLVILAVIGMLTFIFGIASLITGLMYYNNLIIPSWLFPYSTSFSLIYLITALVIWHKGLSAKASTPRAGEWKRVILACSMSIGIVLSLTTYTLIDLSRQIEFTNVNSDLKTRLQGTWPSKPPPHLNAYPLYEQVSNALDEQERDRIRDCVKPDQNALAPETQELLSRNQQLIDTLHQAADRPFHFWGSPVGTSLLLLFQFPDFPSYHHLAGLLGAKAKAEAFSGNPAGAVKELTVIRSIVKHLQSSPQLILWLYSLAVTANEHDYMEYFLAQNPSVDGLFPFPIHNTQSILPSCKGWLINEAANELQLPFLMMQRKEVIENLMRTHDEMYESIGGAPSIFLPYVLHPLPRSLWRVFIGRSYLSNVRDKWEKINIIAESKYSPWRDFSPLKAGLEGKRGSLLNFLLYPILGGNDPNAFPKLINRRIVMIDVYNRLMDVALAASAYREAKGFYPESVDDLVPAFLETIPIDPYDGKTLKMKKVQGGLDFYSVGPDQEDLKEVSRWLGPIHFYLGREAYEKYRVKPANIKRAKEERRREREIKMKRGKKIKPGPKKRRKKRGNNETS